MVMVVVAGIKILNQIPNGNPAGQLSKHHGNELSPA